MTSPDIRELLDRAVALDEFSAKHAKNGVMRDFYAGLAKQCRDKAREMGGGE